MNCLGQERRPLPQPVLILRVEVSVFVCFFGLERLWLTVRGVAAHFEASSRLACYGIVVAAEGGIDGDGSMTSDRNHDGGVRLYVHTSTTHMCDYCNFSNESYVSEKLSTFVIGPRKDLSTTIEWEALLYYITQMPVAAAYRTITASAFFT